MNASNFTFRLPDDLRKALELQAAEEDRSIAYLIVRYLQDGLRVAGYLPVESTDE